MEHKKLVLDSVLLDALRESAITKEAYPELTPIEFAHKILSIATHPLKRELVRLTLLNVGAAYSIWSNHGTNTINMQNITNHVHVLDFDDFVDYVSELITVNRKLKANLYVE